MSRQILSVSPHIRSARTTRSIMLDVIIAMLPALAASAILFGMRAVYLTVISSGVCVLLEFLWEKLLKKPVTVQDLSAVVTGMLVAFNVPVSMPIWMLVVGDIAAIILVKQLFGGLGCNFVNPALVGRLVMMFSFATAMTTFTGSSGIVDAAVSATPLADPASYGWDSFFTLFLGAHGGAIGETCALAIILGGVYLCVRKVIKPIIPLCFIGSCLLFTFLFGGAHPVLQVFEGGLLCGAFFMATDYVTSPITDWGKVIFGVFIGFVTAVIRVFGNYPEGVTFAILFGNVLVPYINELTMTKPLGAIIPEKKKKEAAS
ncbi:MAG: RnfABCDGE type electron transport complex subunit D [Lachnospiraceae bacterium]|nr:RnfABCDGE type electron transport complex subunit D [Lachnospiraceae bacterium]MBP5254950.1 RnfABCDGE type electron transport complex subunit D [Lachnospiraceae bacterium]